MTSAAQPTRTTATATDLGPAYREAAETVAIALAKPPKQLGAEVDIAEQQVVRIRDRLIDNLRRADTEPDDPRRAALKRVNMALSLIVGVEYAAGGIQRKPLAEAGKLLRELAAQAAGDAPPA